MSTIRFEEGYMLRNNRSIISSPDIALTELVANAWDAGAMLVEIKLPEDDESFISISDDGCGMTDEEFKERWMTLNYNRERHQGREVVFPDDVDNGEKKRIAYGRNGVGRHAMLCFSDGYSVETWRDGKGMRYSIGLSAGDEPYRITEEKDLNRDGHGTTICAYVSKNKPNIDRIKEILSGRFIYDPQFVVKVNDEELSLQSSEGVVKEYEASTEDGINMKILVVDSSKFAHASKQHGVAFWVGGRLVGNPSWSIQNIQFLDARFKPARRYTFIVQSEDVADDVLPDWSGFYKSDHMDSVFNVVNEYVHGFISETMSEQVLDLKKEVITSKRDDLENLSISDKRDISTFMDLVTKNNPMIDADFLHASVDAVIKINKSKNGIELLNQLSSMESEELDKLSDLLKLWDVNDIVSVLDEIDKRILVVEAISRLYDKKETDELHVLHPLVLDARWLFGPEFDSPMYTSNSSLATVVKTLFNDNEYDLNAIENSRKRPDIVFLNQATMSFVCTEKGDSEASGLMKPDQILIIELKRGGFEIGSKEVSQAEYYVRQIKKSRLLHKESHIHAFVVGANIGDIDTHRDTDSGVIDVVSYGSLVDTANVKLFRLRDQLAEHYDNIGDESLIERVLKEPHQAKLSIQ